MISDDQRELTDLERAVISEKSNYIKLNTPKNIGFSLDIYPVVLSSNHLHSIQWNWHQELEIIYLEKGEIEILSDENAFIVTPGNCVFINQNVLHCPRLSRAEEAVYYSLVFHPDMIFGYGSTPLYLEYVAPILEDSSFKCIPLHSNNNTTSKIIPLVTEIKDFWDTQIPGYELLCKSNLYRIWAILFSIESKNGKKQMKSKRLMHDEQRIKDAITYIEENYTEPISLEEIADSIHISKSECCRCFQRVLHLSPFDYLLHFRILQATKFIRQQDPLANSMANLAISVGFSNISYFNKVFKKHMNMTPSEYKKQQKEII